MLAAMLTATEERVWSLERAVVQSPHALGRRSTVRTKHCYTSRTAYGADCLCILYGFPEQTHRWCDGLGGVQV
jgi:hypothetical protein